MATVLDEGGREIEVVAVEAIATLASVSALGKELPVNAAERIQRAMAAAVALAYSKGITDPEKVRELMLLAREDVKRELYAPQKNQTEK